MKHEGLIESVRHRLLNHSRARGESFDFILARYGVERFLYRLGKSSQAHRYILKGATLFHVWNDKLHRPTRDLDLLGSGPDSLEAIQDSILEILRIECSEDGLVFDESSLHVDSIREEVRYGGARAKFRALLGNVRIPVQVDIGFGDVVTPAPETQKFPVILPGMPAVSLMTYPVYTVIAEKFEAVVTLDSQNSRMKDFFDLDFLLAGESLDAVLLDEAIRATFNRRGSMLPTALPTGLTDAFATEREVMWNAFLGKNGLDHDHFSSVVGRLRNALEWIWKV